MVNPVSHAPNQSNANDETGNPDKDAPALHGLTARMSHDEERVNGRRVPDARHRAPRHWLNPLVELSRLRGEYFPTS